MIFFLKYLHHCQNNAYIYHMLNANKFKNMKKDELKLIELLKVETKSLLVEFLKRTAEFAKNLHAERVEQSNWSVEKWAEFIGVKTEIRGGRTTFERGFWNTKESTKYDRLKTRAQKAARMDVNDFIDLKKDLAREHYDRSIEKLALRIMKKGLNIDNLKAETSHIDVNISTVLTDGEKSVRAFTIIAGGPVQKPHYRYLIK